MNPQPSAAPRYHVDPGGSSVRIDLGDGVVAEKLSVGDMDNNAYLIGTAEHYLLIDAAADPARLRDLIAHRRLVGVVTTHRHHDHVGALADLAGEAPLATWAGTPDVEAIEQATGVASRPVWDGDRIELGSAGSLEVIGLVGHTPGSIALVWRGTTGVHLFTGDSLFPGGVGRTTSDQDFQTLLSDLEAKIFDRFDEAAVHPGHGDATTLAAERPQLATWRARGW